jgi:hypothetical protein
MKLAAGMMFAVLAMLYFGTLWADRRDKREKSEKRDR